MKCSVYILQSNSSGRFYICSSINPVTRAEYHNRGNVKATRNKGPWKLVFLQEFANIKTARQIEYQLKQKKSKKYNQNDYSGRCNKIY